MCSLGVQKYWAVGDRRHWAEAEFSGVRWRGSERGEAAAQGPPWWREGGRKDG